ncbi:pyridoxamine 5'-phosphate oxidase family protein [Candidatus Hikarchaeum yamanae]|uniref:pyridoxamine 5'-phosphate oxidase family protein n=1 Tax=Candidatus Hikarchaeum yamanae TaxID=2675326 RepID=UPI0039EC35FC|tara:strand:- start:22713 stop:23774 length:1062 start_codon:yes stop_codon:yes gene_type:complete
MQPKKTTTSNKPGSVGEHLLQKEYGDTDRANSFYETQMLDHLNDRMKKLLSAQEMVFIATSDANGESDCSFRAGPIGFVRIIDSKTIAYPEYRGNGVHASLGNILENPHIGMIFVDFFGSTVGLHVNGRASIQENQYVRKNFNLPSEAFSNVQTKNGKKPERWVVVDIQEAYIHCAKHVPKLKKLNKKIHWGTDDETYKGGDFFNVTTSAKNHSPISPTDLNNRLYFERAKQHCEWCFTWLDSPHVHQLIPIGPSHPHEANNLLVVCQDCLSKIQSGSIDQSYLQHRLDEQMQKWSAHSYSHLLNKAKENLTPTIAKIIDTSLSELSKEKIILRIIALLFILHYLSHFFMLHA